MNSDLCSCKGITLKDYRLSRWGVETGPCSDRTEWGHSSVGSGPREAECGRLALPDGWEGVRQSLTSHSTMLAQLCLHQKCLLLPAFGARVSHCPQSVTGLISLKCRFSTPQQLTGKLLSTLV